MDLLLFVLLDPQGRLRSGWRLLLHTVLLVLGLGVAVGLLVGLVVGLTALEVDVQAMPLLPLAAQGILTCIALLIVTAVSALVLDARWRGGLARGHLRGAGLGPPVLRAVGEGALGVLVAVVGMGITVGGMALGGMEASIPGMDAWGAALWLGTAITLVFAAWMEELLFRGYLFQWVGGALARLGHLGLGLMGRRGGLLGGLVDVAAFAVPTLVLSALFGIAHVTNPSAGWLAVVNTVLAGLWFTVILLRTRSLWGAVTSHFAWNALTLLVLGLPVSGIGEESGFVVPSLIDLKATGPDWISGGAYGPEGSVACLAGLVVMIALSAVLPRRKAQDGIAAVRRVQPGERDDVEG